MVVSVPYSKKIQYTLYTQGCTADIPHIGSDGFAHFMYSAGTAVALFYTFRDFRRAYVITEPKKNNGGTVSTLPGVSCPVRIIYTAKGRRVDHLKRSLYILTQDDRYEIFRFPLMFWYRLAALIQFSGAQKSDIELLYEEFKTAKRRSSR